MTFTVIWNRDRTTRINEVDVDYDEDIIIEYEVIGQYRPAIWYPIDDATPEEYPEYNIISATDPQGQDIADYLTTEESDRVLDLIIADYDKRDEKRSCGGQEYDPDKAYEEARQREIDNDI